MVAGAEQMVVGQPDNPPDDWTFDQLYQQLWWPMLRLATGLVDDAGIAEDVIQDAFAAVYRRWDTIRDRPASVSYLRASVVNASRSVLRRRIVARKHLRLVQDEAVESADHEILLGADHDLVRQAMTTLPDRQREVLTLRFVAELSDPDIAAATGLSQAGVRSASSRGLAALRRALGGQL